MSIGQVCGIKRVLKSKYLFTFRCEMFRIIFPNHGSSEVGKGLEKKIMKQAGIK
jgi:hypothetical protein